MARADLAHPSNAPGDWFVDTRCIRCDAARDWAPDLIGMDAVGRSFVAAQPMGPEQTAALWRAAAACPTRSIGHREQFREPAGVFPYQLTAGVWALGNNALSSFGGHSYLATRTGGNLMIDSPRFGRALAERVDATGGVAHILLSHRDDVADAERWAERYGARVWIGAADADAAPYATDLIGDAAVEIVPGVAGIPAPGHTEGHILYHLDDRHLFTGDTLHWNRRRGELAVFPEQTFYSWAVLADTVERMAALPVDWLFPGHGQWRHIGRQEWARQVSGLSQAMRELGQGGWAQRSDGTYNWY